MTKMRKFSSALPRVLPAAFLLVVLIEWLRPTFHDLLTRPLGIFDLYAVAAGITSIVLSPLGNRRGPYLNAIFLAPPILAICIALAALEADRSLLNSFVLPILQPLDRNQLYDLLGTGIGVMDWFGLFVGVMLRLSLFRDPIVGQTLGIISRAAGRSSRAAIPAISLNTESSRKVTTRRARERIYRVHESQADRFVRVLPFVGLALLGAFLIAAVVAMADRELQRRDQHGAIYRTSSVAGSAHQASTI